jgi:hypothetical protein
MYRLCGNEPVITRMATLSILIIVINASASQFQIQMFRSRVDATINSVKLDILEIAAIPEVPACKKSE